MRPHIFVMLACMGRVRRRLWQRERHVSAAYLFRWRGVEFHRRGGTEDQVLAAFDLIHGGHALERGIQFVLPEDLPVRDIQCANLAVARAGEDQPTGGYYRTYLRKMRSGIFDSFGRQLRNLAQW